MYDRFPTEQLLFLLGTIVIPIVTGIISAILPASKAVKIQPYQGLTGGFTNSKRTEKSFRFVFGTVGICLFLGIVTLLMQAIPETTEVSVTENNQSVEGTSGEVRGTFATDDEKNKSVDEADSDTESKDVKDILDKKIENAWRVINMGDKLEEKYKTYIYKMVKENPKGIELEKNNTELITITAELIDVEEGDIGKALYKPHAGDIYLLDDMGNQYNRIQYEVLVAENWSKIYMKSPGRAKTSLTFEVPKNVKRLVLIENSNLTAGDIIVKIK